MPQSKKGSILLYTLFLTSFLVLFFVSFQWEIEKKLAWVQGLEQSIEGISNTQDALISLKGKPEASRDIDTSGDISLISLTQSGNTFTDTNNGTGSFEYQITSTGWASAMAFDIVTWGPIRYAFASFNSGSESSATLVSSGVVSSHTSIALSGAWAEYILVIEWLGGHTKYTLDASTTTIIPQSSSYKQVHTINGYSKATGVYDIVNFVPKTRTGVLYESLGMYLKE